MQPTALVPSRVLVATVLAVQSMVTVAMALTSAAMEPHQTRNASPTVVPMQIVVNSPRLLGLNALSMFAVGNMASVAVGEEANNMHYL